GDFVGSQGTLRRVDGVDTIFGFYTHNAGIQMELLKRLRVESSKCSVCAAQRLRIPIQERQFHVTIGGIQDLAYRLDGGRKLSVRSGELAFQLLTQLLRVTAQD